MKASSICFPVAVLLVLIGMAWGIEMAISQDHSAMPAHAHLNLLGWVSLFLFGIFYHLHPEIDRSRIALVQAYVWIAGTVILVIGVGMVHTGHESGDPIAAVGSLIVLFGMLMFGWIVIGRQKGGQVAGQRLTPAE
jgi:peptidoglycan/LPS O-acetylase OafA/YrhL